MKKRGWPPVWLSALLLLLVLLWKMLGAPMTVQQVKDLETPMWQARVLLPSRLSRVMTLWLPAQVSAQGAETLPEDGMDEDAKKLAKLETHEERMLNVYLARENTMVQMPLESYVCGVVAAEMPAAYHLEALKAQAVAARTRALWQMEQGGCSEHESADICTDSAHCQGYASVGECKENWGKEYSVYRERIVQAVQQTRDELLTYQNKPITVMYHAISGGKTEDVATVFSQSLPYLVSVDSAGEEGARGFYADSSFSFAEAANLLNAAMPGMKLTAEQLRQTLTIGEYTPTGRVRSVLVNGKEIAATVFRAALGLRSTWFTLSADSEKLVFHQRGYGHGVGMSQVGANSMAADGADYRAVLAHYYPGTTLQER
ncbi:MAG: stage II sporulation protein D [Clostridia bacterium]